MSEFTISTDRTGGRKFKVRQQVSAATPKDAGKPYAPSIRHWRKRDGGIEGTTRSGTRVRVEPVA